MTNNLRADRVTESQGATKFIRTGEAATRTPASASRKEMPELKGDGILFPALLIGLGQTGMHLLHRLREVLVERFESLSRLPHVRMRLLDTDPEITRQAATAGRGSVAFSSQEILVAGLNRPSYYLKPRDGKAGLDSWLNPRMLYRIPRSGQTTGVRALGRLAYCDNFRTIQRHLQADLEACLDPVALNTAARQWQLGLRTSRPRVYILCGLAGATGGGMFLDLAYTIRSILHNCGFDQPDLVGLFLLPPLDGTRTQVMALGNMVAALQELNYFGSPGTRFFAQYGDRDLIVESTDPPFSRYFLLPMPEEADEVACREVYDLAAQFLYRDLFTGLGKTADLARAGLPSTPWQQRGQFYSTFGLYQLSWPRRALVRRTARALCLQLLNRWVCRDSKSQRESIQVWLQEQWAEKGLGAERFISRLRDACQEVLQKPPETIFYALIEPLTRQIPISPVRRGSPRVAHPGSRCSPGPTRKLPGHSLRGAIWRD